jgi:hypothetical protein
VIAKVPLKFCSTSPPVSVAVPLDVATNVKKPLIELETPPIDEIVTPVDPPVESMVVTPVVPSPTAVMAPGDPPKLRIDSA